MGLQSRENNAKAYENDHNFDEYFEQEGNPDGVLHEETTKSIQYSIVGMVRKKRKGRDALDGLVEVIMKMPKDTNARLQYLATRIGYEFDWTKARKDVFKLVGLYLPKLGTSPGCL